jgi:hypothetical protein
MSRLYLETGLTGNLTYYQQDVWYPDEKVAARAAYAAPEVTECWLLDCVGGSQEMFILHPTIRALLATLPSRCCQCARPC